MKKINCPYLNTNVELTGERKRHIAKTHPELLPSHEQEMIGTIADPDEIRRSKRYANALLFCKWFSSVKEGKYIVVVILSEASPKERHWIITAYITRKLTHGEIVWQKN